MKWKAIYLLAGFALGAIVARKVERDACAVDRTEVQLCHFSLHHALVDLMSCEDTVRHAGEGWVVWNRTNGEQCYAKTSGGACANDAFNKLLGGAR